LEKTKMVKTRSHYWKSWSISKENKYFHSIKSPIL
jgi:hypothetical protein